MKVALIYNYAQHYRTNIFTVMDQQLDCDFFFGDFMDDVKKMDYSLIKKGNVSESHTKYIYGDWYFQPGIISLLNKDYTSYILLGETRALSTWLFCILARLFYPNKKVYFWSHGWYGKETRLESFIKKVLFKLPNSGVFLYGNYARGLMIKEGFDPNKLFTIHNSLAYDHQLEIRRNLSVKPIFIDHFKNDNPNLMFVGRLTPVKKLDLALRALDICKKMGHNYNITFVGGGEKTEELKQITKELKLENNVWFYGPCYDEVVLGDIIYNADLCVSPGNVGLTAMHAMAFGCPVITHNNFPYQMPEFEAIKDGVTGTFFNYNDVESLADSIINWFSLVAKDRNKIREACMKEIDNSWNPYFQIEVLKSNLK